ncbi:MAG: TraB/GumN family protein [Bacteroidales bacterium]|nr:TraB/GumN family protein [Bacteroidales bacterium]MDD3166612.1 TraB/GumN family protein [Bacteroidales bacterium]HKL92183.1 TraB/GumN family protein [Bacteroidales bacterium]
MKKIGFVFLMLFCISMGVSAQLLWKISGKGLTKPSYVFGTHHLVSAGQLPIYDAVVKQALLADVFLGEVNMQEPNMQQILMQHAQMDQNLNDLVSEEAYAMLVKTFQESVGVPLNQVSRMKPMMLMSLFLVLDQMKQTGQSNLKSIDQLLQERAVQQKIPVYGLETISEQAALLFDSMRLERQAELLVRTLGDLPTMRNEQSALLKAYLEGDLEALSKMADVSQSGMTPQEMKLLNDQRNRKWMQRIPEYMASGSCFIAVGSLHLTGEAGLLKQLKQQGYRVEAAAL